MVKDCEECKHYNEEDICNEECTSGHNCDPDALDRFDKTATCMHGCPWCEENRERNEH